MSVVAMNRAFGIGPKRFMKYAKELMEVTEWYQEMLDNTDEVYANEKLRREAQKCSGTEIEPLYDKGCRRLWKSGTRRTSDREYFYLPNDPEE